MTKYSLTLHSKNKQSLNEFLKYNSKAQNSQTIHNLLKNKKSKKKISILKSPHVNKTAQEQFEYTNYSVKISFYSWEIKKHLILLKKIKNQVFPDIKMKINFLKNKKTITLKQLNIHKIVYYSPILLNDNNQKLGIKPLISDSSSLNYSLLKKTLNYFKILDSCHNF